MRKFTIVMLVLVLLGTQVFADGHNTFTVEPVVELSAKAELEIGYDLDGNKPTDADAKGDFYIKNTNDIDVKLTIVSKQNKTSNDGDGIIGFIELKDIQTVLNSKKDTVTIPGAVRALNDAEKAAITALEASKAAIMGTDAAATAQKKALDDQIAAIRAFAAQDTDGDGVVFEADGTRDTGDLITIPKVFVKQPGYTAHVRLLGPALFVEVSNVDNTLDYDVAQDFTVFKDLGANVAGYNEIKSTLGDDYKPSAGGSGSFTIGTSNDIFDAKIVLRDDDRGTTDGVNVGGNIDLKVLKDLIGLSIKAGIFVDTETGVDDKLDIGGGLSLSWKPDFGVENFSLAVEAGVEGLVDGSAESGKELNLELSAHLGLGLFNAVTIDGYLRTNALASPSPTKGIDIRAKVSTGSLLDDFFKLSLIGDIGLLSESASGSLIGIGADLDINVIKGLTGIAIVPYANVDVGLLDLKGVTANNTTNSTATKTQLKLKAGVKFDVVPNTTFNLFYENSDLIGEESLAGTKTAGLAKTGKIGLLTTIKF